MIRIWMHLSICQVRLILNRNLMGLCIGQHTVSMPLIKPPHNQAPSNLPYDPISQGVTGRTLKVKPNHDIAAVKNNK